MSAGSALALAGFERETQQVVKVNQEEETHTGLHIMAMRSSSPRFTWLR